MLTYVRTPAPDRSVAPAPLSPDDVAWPPLSANYPYVSRPLIQSREPIDSEWGRRTGTGRPVWTFPFC